MSLEYKSSLDCVRGAVVGEDGKRIHDYSYQCFGRTFSGEMQESLRVTGAKYYDFFFVDSLTGHLKSTDSTAKYIELLYKMGCIQNSEVIQTTAEEDQNILRCTSWGTRPIVRMRLDIHKCSAQELFLVGECVRIIATSPQIVVDFLKLTELEPGIELSLLLQMAHVISFGIGHRSQAESNVLIYSGTALLNGKTFTDFYKETKQVPINIASGYGLMVGKDAISYQNYFSKKNLMHLTYSSNYERNTNIPTSRYSGVKYSEDTIDTFLDEEKMKAALHTNAFSRSPTLPPKEEKSNAIS